MAAVCGSLRTRWCALMIAVLAWNQGSSVAGFPAVVGRLRLVKGLSISEGVVETFIFDEWRTVCGQDWSLDLAGAVCRQLGHSGGAAEASAVAVPDQGPLSYATEPVLVDLLSCVLKEQEQGEFTDCDEYVSSGDNSGCEGYQVAWVRCMSDPVKPAPLIQMRAQNMQVASPDSTAIAPIVTDIGGGRVTLDWSDWKESIDGDSLFLIRFVIKYRVIGNDASVDYSTAAEPRSYQTRYTVRNLEERTKYEFIVEAVRLGPDGQEVGPASQPVFVVMPCWVPSHVSNASAWPQAGTGTALELSWQRPLDPDCPPTSYVIEFKQQSVGQCEEAAALPDSVTRAGSTNNTRFTIGGLQPHSTYTVYVTASNNHGTSTPWQTTVTTNEAVPSVGPSGIHTVYKSETRLKVRWDAIPCSSQGGALTGYTYILVDVTMDKVTHTGHTMATRVELSGVQATRRYKFLVAGETAMGTGPYAVFTVNAKPKLADICGRQAPLNPNLDLHAKEIVQEITSGKAAHKGSTPWLAQLWYVDKGSLFCHGSILDSRWIVTAAHCITSRGATKDDIMVQLGDFDRSLPEEEQQAYRVENIIVNKRFDTELFDADVALIKLARDIEFTDYIRPICMPPKPQAKRMLSPGRSGVVSSWGKLSPVDEKYPRHLKTVRLPVKAQVTCKRSTNYTVTSNMFCAGYSRAGMGDTCEGDSGAPFVAKVTTNDKWYLLGVVSWGEGCDKRDKFGFYVRLHRYIAWIRKHTGIKFS